VERVLIISVVMLHPLHHNMIVIIMLLVVNIMTQNVIQQLNIVMNLLFQLEKILHGVMD
jgi:hypothetical protein